MPYAALYAASQVAWETSAGSTSEFFQGGETRTPVDDITFG